jgi:hypothetical protein
LGPFNGATNCDPTASQIGITNSPDVEFNFDSFKDINGGIVLNGRTVVKVRAVNNPAQTCKWNLIMYVNNGGGVTPPSEWEELTVYGAGTAASPSLNLIEVRVSNACGTPINNSLWQSFAALNGSSINIINDVTNPGLNFPGFCNGSQVNTEGSHITNYGEYSFTIDYKIMPGFIYKPGRYNIKITFCLSEM